MKDYLKFCVDYNLDVKSSKSLNIFYNFKDFKQRIKQQINAINNSIILDCYNSVR